MNPGPLHFLPCNPGTFSISRYSRFKIEHDWAPEASSVHVQTCQDALHPPRVFTPKCSKSFRPPLRNGRDLSWWHPNSHHRQNLINKNHAFINAQYEIIQKIVFSQSSCLSSPSWNSWPAWECRTRQFNWLKRARHQGGWGCSRCSRCSGVCRYMWCDHVCLGTLGRGSILLWDQFLQDFVP